MAVGTFIGVGRSLEAAVRRAEHAEQLGYASAYVTHIAARDSFTVLAAYAARTERIRLGTGVLPIYSRTPVATAQAAATLDELSRGRMVLGLGLSHAVTNEGWYGQRIERPVREMREYVTAVRAILRGGDPPSEGRFATGFHFTGYAARRELPVYLAALSPAMLRLAGELGDGVMLWLCNPDYVREVVIPEVTRGRERAGKTLDEFDVVAAVPAAVTPDPSAARDRLRGELVVYFSLPFYRTMLERSGFGDDIAAYDRALASGDGQAAGAVISDRVLTALAAIGDANDAQASVARYLDAGVTSPCLGGVPGTDFELTLESLADLNRQAR